MRAAVRRPAVRTADADCDANPNCDSNRNAESDADANPNSNSGRSFDCLRYISSIEYRCHGHRWRWRRTDRIYNRVGDAC